MFMQPRNSLANKQEDEFTRPVESIMRCEDFKSNFARRLSNRYISKSPVLSPRQDAALKLCPDNNNTEKVPEMIEPCSQLSKNGSMEQRGEATESICKSTVKNSDIRHTEVNALNMEVETLRWQLAQTEANRQMHIALLQQIVTFLNRVKEHIECNTSEAQIHEKEKFSTKVLPRSFNSADLPRSRSVIHVNKNVEYSLGSVKKINTKKISKSINNDNGYKDFNHIWTKSQLFLSSKSETTQKISEEITRLITLANTVLSTKLPDLACTCTETINEINLSKVIHNTKNVQPKNKNDTTQVTLNLIEENMLEKSNVFALNTVHDGPDTYNGITNKFIEVNDFNSLSDFIVSPTPLTCGLENHFIVGTEMKNEQRSSAVKCDSATNKSNYHGITMEKRNDINHTSNFIEDESGFSSMSSFQEIGIPIINIIPPSPCKEVGYIDEMDDIFNEAEKWKNDSIELDKQTIKVFWV